MIIDLYKYKKWKHVNNLSNYYSLKMSRSTGKTKRGIDRGIIQQIKGNTCTKCGKVEINPPWSNL